MDLHDDVGVIVGIMGRGATTGDLRQECSGTADQNDATYIDIPIMKNR